MFFVVSLLSLLSFYITVLLFLKIFSERKNQEMVLKMPDMRHLEIDIWSRDESKLVKAISKFRRRAHRRARRRRGGASRGRASLDSADSDGLPR